MVHRQWSWKRSWPRWARKLVTDGTNSFYRVLVDPRDGAPLEIGRKNYRLPEAVKRWLRMRDGKCTFPGCTNHTLDNETNHLLAWHHGETTGVSNLGQACPKHHRLKHCEDCGGWSGTGWQSRYWSFCPVVVTHQTHGPRGCSAGDLSVRGVGRPVPARPTSVT